MLAHFKGFLYLFFSVLATNPLDYIGVLKIFAVHTIVKGNLNRYDLHVKNEIKLCIEDLPLLTERGRVVSATSIGTPVPLPMKRKCQAVEFRQNQALKLFFSCLFLRAEIIRKRAEKRATHWERHCIHNKCLHSMNNCRISKIQFISF